MNISQKHTPGPWIATHIIGSWWIEEDDPTAFCRRRIAIVDDGSGIDSPAANARLIAAAPEMLAALESICTEISGGLCMNYTGATGICPNAAKGQCAVWDAIQKAKGASK